MALAELCVAAALLAGRVDLLGATVGDGPNETCTLLDLSIQVGNQQIVEEIIWLGVQLHQPLKQDASTDFVMELARRSQDVAATLRSIAISDGPDLFLAR